MDELVQSKMTSIHGSTTYRESKKGLGVKTCKKIEMLDLVYQYMGRLSRYKSFKEIINQIPSMLENLLTFDKLSIIVPDRELYKMLEGDSMKFRSKKLFHNGNWIRILFTENYPCSGPQFRNLEQLSIGRRM